MAVTKHTSGIAHKRALIHVRKERKFNKSGPLVLPKKERLSSGGRNLSVCKDVIVASLKGAIFVGSAANDLN